MECIVGVEDISGFKEGDSINTTVKKGNRSIL